MVRVQVRSGLKHSASPVTFFLRGHRLRRLSFGNKGFVGWHYTYSIVGCTSRSFLLALEGTVMASLACYVLTFTAVLSQPVSAHSPSWPAPSCVSQAITN